MPPRNSYTKSFRKYKYDSPKVECSIKDEAIENALLKPSKAINNGYYISFEKYKHDKEIKGLNPADACIELEKDLEDGDPRYINTDWYRGRACGDLEAWGNEAERRKRKYFGHS